MIVVDTSVWISYLLKDDANHSLTRPWATRYIRSGSTAAVPLLFAIEVGAAMKRRTGSTAQAQEAVSTIFEDDFFDLVAIDRLLALDAATVAVSFGLRGADALFVALAQHMGLPLITWDREQRDRAGQIIDVLTPAEALKRIT